MTYYSDRNVVSIILKERVEIVEETRERVESSVTASKRYELDVEPALLKA